MVVFPMKPRLLIVELHHLGDAMMSLPFVRSASEKYEVHILCRSATAPVYRLLPDAPILHEWEPPWAESRNGGAWASLCATRTMGRRLSAENFAVAVCVWADARCAILMAESRASRRYGFPMTHGNYYAANLPWRRKRRLWGRLLETIWQITHPHFPLFTEDLHRSTTTQSHMQCWEQIAQALGLSCNNSIPWIQAAAPPEDVVKFCETAHQNKRQILAIHPHARLPSKQWPLPLWRQLITQPAVTERFSILEIVPPKQDPLGAPSHHLVTTHGISTLAAVLNSAEAILCHDSFPAHLAAALGKPVVSIFGSGEPDWFAPWNNRHRVVQQHLCPLHPCIDRCGMDHYLCLDHIPLHDVLQQLEHLPRLP